MPCMEAQQILATLDTDFGASLTKTDVWHRLLTDRNSRDGAHYPFFDGKRVGSQKE